MGGVTIWSLSLSIADINLFIIFPREGKKRKLLMPRVSHKKILIKSFKLKERGKNQFHV